MMGTSFSWSRPSAARFTLAVIALMALVLPAPAGAQLPAGPGQAETIKVGWEDVITKMGGLGAKGTDAELDAVLDYLATHFKGEAAVPLNLNRATSVELESVAGLLRRESAAWMAYRAKRPCTTLDDLRAVPGIDFKKIEKRRERLVCF